MVPTQVLKVLNFGVFLERGLKKVNCTTVEIEQFQNVRFKNDSGLMILISTPIFLL